MRRYIDRLHSVAGRGPGPWPGTAGRRERRRPAEATPRGQLRVWTTLFGPFTGGAWERQAPPRGLPSGAMPPAGRGGPGPFTPLRCPGFGEGSPAVCRDSAADPPGRHRWGSASRRLCLGTDPWVLRSPGTSSGAEGVGLVHVGSGDPREPHRRSVRWGSPGRLTRCGHQVCAGGQGGRTT